MFWFFSKDINSLSLAIDIQLITKNVKEAENKTILNNPALKAASVTKEVAKE